MAVRLKWYFITHQDVNDLFIQGQRLFQVVDTSFLFKIGSSLNKQVEVVETVKVVNDLFRKVSDTFTPKPNCS